MEGGYDLVGLAGGVRETIAAWTGPDVTIERHEPTEEVRRLVEAHLG